MWVYCSFGIDDEQIPAYPSTNPPWEEGLCCQPGQVKVIDQFNQTICQDFDQCGFNINSEGKCYLPDTDPLTGEPLGYFEREYFNQRGCVDWLDKESCCFNISKYGGYGNWPCPIISSET